MIKAIILDWSGVVSDDLELVYEIAGKVSRRLGKPFMTLEQFRERFDLPYMDFYRSMGIKTGKSRIDGLYKEIFIRSGKKPAPFKFAKKMLTWLKERDIRLAVLSSHPQDLLMEEIGWYGFGDVFDVCVGSAHDKRTIIAGLIEQLGTAKDETLLVGDMAHDIEAGNLAGLLTAAVLSGYHSREKLEAKEPNFIMNDIRDLHFIVDGFYA